MFPVFAPVTFHVAFWFGPVSVLVPAPPSRTPLDVAPAATTKLSVPVPPVRFW